MKIVVCIGSACHLKGARRVVENLQYLISQHELKDSVELGGTFCMGNCQDGVCVTIDGVDYSVTPDNTEDFFRENVLSKI